MFMEHIDSINFKTFTFPNLFLTRGKLTDTKIFKALDTRDQLALEFMESILSGKKSTNLYQKDVKELSEFKTMLKWILETGSPENNMSDSYDEIIDKSAILLAKEFKDESSFPIIIDIIFKRHAKNQLIHDLIWGFFESHKLSTLSLVAENLKSNDRVDFNFACELLNIQLYDNMYRINQDNLYISFLKWLKKNKNFIYFTGESYQQKTNPIIYAINHDAKYLCKKVKIENGEFLNDLLNHEKKLLYFYNAWDSNTRNLLEHYSLELYNQNYFSWQYWIKCPISLQVQMALLGGYHDLYIK